MGKKKKYSRSNKPRFPEGPKFPKGKALKNPPKFPY